MKFYDVQDLFKNIMRDLALYLGEVNGDIGLFMSQSLFKLGDDTWKFIML